MKGLMIFALFSFFLLGCSEADIKMVRQELAKGFKDISKNNHSRKSYRKVKSKKPVSNQIIVVNSKLPECRGITLHKAYVDHTPFYYGGKVITTIPLYRVDITNKGKRRKVTFDIYYKQDFGNREYRTKQPTGHYLKEFGPVIIRANTINKTVNLEKPKGREVYEKIELVACD